MVVSSNSGEDKTCTQCTLEQSPKPPNAYIGPCNELATHPGVYPAFAAGIGSSILVTPKRNKAAKKTKKNKILLSWVCILNI